MERQPGPESSTDNMQIILIKKTPFLYQDQGIYDNKVLCVTRFYTSIKIPATQHVNRYV